MNISIDRNVSIRPFRKEDRPAVREICSQTGLKGKPTRLFFEDEGVTPMLFADYYLDYEPESCFVAEWEGQVVGYILGCKDSRQYARVLTRRILPRVALHILLNLCLFRYREKQTFWTMWWVLTRSWRETIIPPLDDYPGHAHFNVRDDFRGEGLGLELSRAFHAHARAKGVKGLYTVQLEPVGDDRLASFLCRERGYKILKIRPHTAWERATGKKWLAKLMVCNLQKNTKS